MYSGTYTISYSNNLPDYLVDSAQAGTTTGSVATNAVTISSVHLLAGEESSANNFGMIKVFDTRVTKELLTPTVIP